MKKYYAIRKGSTSHVVVESWAVCEVLVKGISGADFKRFNNEQDARDFAQVDQFDQQEENAPSVSPKKKLIKPGKRKPQRKGKRQGKGKCTERKSYRDTATGEFHKNRCVAEYWGQTVGSNFILDTATHCPF